MNPAPGGMFAGSGLGQQEDGHVSLRKLPDDGFHRLHAGAHTFDARPSGAPAFLNPSAQNSSSAVGNDPALPMAAMQRVASQWVPISLTAVLRTLGAVPW